MQRREYLKGVGAVGIVGTVAGCTDLIDAATGGGNSQTHELAGEDAWVDRERTEQNNAVRIDATVELESGYYAADDFTPQANVAYGCEWETEGNQFDVLLLDEDEYDDRFREGDEIQYDMQFSEVGTTGGSVSGTVQAGEYMLVFSNSEVLGSEPEGTVRAEVSYGAGL